MHDEVLTLRRQEYAFNHVLTLLYVYYSHKLFEILRPVVR